MTLATTFLPGAKGRLLPASVPFRYFGAAVFFYAAMWLTLLWGAGGVAGFAGGPGLPLAATHMLTLGVLATSAMGAAFQLLPVATRQPMPTEWPARLGFWLIVPGTFAIGHGMANGTLWAMAAGGTLASLGLLLLVVMMAINLARAKDLPLIAGHGWLAVVSLALVLVLGLALVADFEFGFFADHGAIARAHMVLAGYGFMGMLALGFGQILVPMFALARAPSRALGQACLWLSLAGLALGAGGAFLGNRWIMTAGAAAGLIAAIAHLATMAQIMRTRMRKRMGVSFVLVRIAWAMLPLSLALAIAELHGLLGPRGGMLFGFVLLAGWLLTFLVAILQRIMPFLAAMHAVGKDGKAPLVSELTAELPLKIHSACHLFALVLVGFGIAADFTGAIQAGAVIGLIGALAFGFFTWSLMRRLFGRASTPAEVAS